MITILIVDLFCGAGGVTEGFEKANVKGVEFRVIAGVNHDRLAIESHAVNHPNTHHFVEDIRDLNVIAKVAELSRQAKEQYQRIGSTVYVLLHASLECTNFSNAKGGKPRDADSRSLADYMPKYIDAIRPDFFTVENVREFMSWGPIDENGKPVNRKKGCDYVRWVGEIADRGYQYDHKLLNSADYGAYTSRLRYFALFAKNGLPIAWPTQTHVKNPKGKEIFGQNLSKWKPVKEVLDLSIKGESIFNRKKPLVEKTLERIYAGLIKHVANGEDKFLQKHYSGDPSAKCVSLEGPAGSLTTTDSQSVVSIEPFIVKSLGNNQKTGINNGKSINEPSIAITTQVRQTLVTPEPFMMTYYSGSDNDRVKSIEEPCLTVTTENRHAIVSPEFLLKYYGAEKSGHSVNHPCGAITTNDRLGLVQTSLLLTNQHKNEPRSINEPCPTILTGNHHYLVTTNHGGFTHSIEAPSPVIIARQDKAPISVTTVQFGCPNWTIHPDDSPAMRKIKHFMALYGIGDIYMRMLLVKELLLIQGFPKNYILKGSQTHQKKFIGNSVVPIQMQVWAEAIGDKLLQL